MPSARPSGARPVRPSGSGSASARPSGARPSAAGAAGASARMQSSGAGSPAPRASDTSDKEKHSAWLEAKETVRRELALGEGRVLNGQHRWVLEVFALTVSWLYGNKSPTVQHAIEVAFGLITPDLLAVFIDIFSPGVQDPTRTQQDAAGVVQAMFTGKNRVDTGLPEWVRKIVYGVRTRLRARTDQGETASSLLKRIVDHMKNAPRSDSRASKDTIATLSRFVQTQEGASELLFFLAGEGGTGRLATYLKGLRNGTGQPGKGAEGIHRSLVHAACALGLKDRLEVEVWTLVSLGTESLALQQWIEGIFVIIKPNKGFSDHLANHTMSPEVTAQNSRPARTGGVLTTGVDPRAPGNEDLHHAVQSAWYDRTLECLKHGTDALKVSSGSIKVEVLAQMHGDLLDLKENGVPLKKPDDELFEIIEVLLEKVATALEAGQEQIRADIRQLEGRHRETGTKLDQLAEEQQQTGAKLATLEGVVAEGQQQTAAKLDHVDARLDTLAGVVAEGQQQTAAKLDHVDARLDTLVGVVETLAGETGVSLDRLAGKLDDRAVKVDRMAVDEGDKLDHLASRMRAVENLLQVARESSQESSLVNRPASRSPPKKKVCFEIIACVLPQPRIN